jgi:signal transduction histidine kinase
VLEPWTKIPDFLRRLAAILGTVHAMPDVSNQAIGAEGPGRLLTGESPEVAARQASILFLLAGVLAVVGMATQPDQADQLLTIAAADLASAGLAWWLPWSRWQRYLPLLLCVPALIILGFSTWAFGGFATGTGPFLVLLFAWIGLHFPTWAIAVMTPPAAVAYIAPLVATDQPREVISSAVIILPTVVGIAAIIAKQVASQHEARDQLYQMERWRAALTAMLAHDVRSPLASVQLALGALRKDAGRLSADQREAIIATALRQTSRMSRLAAGLLDLDRIDIRGALKLDLHEVPLRQAVHDAVGYLETSDVVIDVDQDLIIVADPQRLEQILVNLTTNALRYGDPPVIISEKRVGDAVRIHVRDQGPGVPEGRRPYLFSRFNSPGSNGDSVGLGLWIVRELARAHGGEVSYEDAHPGACFAVTLPIAPRQ